jgi:alpha-amylase/alpha-mannosidase (GH57 family)
MSERYVCVHGHFYQPPRENPWLEAIELQDSAYPDHDWNERITGECYAANTMSRMLDETGSITQMVNNYARMSFNFGPTLLSWMEEKAPAVYQGILEADRMGQERFSGHGPALAQPYNHMILPLANRRDRYTQLTWGIRDFEHRFGRKPEGMWLPETAVDLDSLDLMVQLGIRFTILAPHQARRVRQKGKRSWRDVSGGRIDPTRAYTLSLPSGRGMDLFFYDGPISRAVAFEGVLSQGESFANRLLSGFSDARDWAQLMHIATDGESYGHHHRMGDMTLAYALDHIESRQLARLTVYGEYLEKHPPRHEVEILENTSWSCAHGLERWKGDCGCNSGGYPGWNQRWRRPLRESMDWLRDTLASSFESLAGSLLKEPWEGRDDYIGVLLARSEENVEAFFGRHAARTLDGEERVRALQLLEMQRHAMLMYTSCGWFFNELSGLETVQVIQYAGRAIQLAQQLGEEGVEAGFLERVERARSNLSEHGDGRRIYEKFVVPARVDLLAVGAHYAISSLFDGYGRKDRIFCYSVTKEDLRSSEVGKAKLSVGRIRITSEVTREERLISFAAFHLGDHNVSGGVREFQGEEPYGLMAWEVTEAFSKADFPEAIRRIDRHFGPATFSLRSLFRDEQRKITAHLLEETLEETAAAYRQLYERHAPLMRFLKDLNIPAPKGLSAAAELVVNDSLRRAFQKEEIDPAWVEGFLDDARTEGISLDVETLEYALRKRVEGAAANLLQNPSSLDALQRCQTVLELAGNLPFEVNLWEVQNIVYTLRKSSFPAFLADAEGGDEKAGKWVRRFKDLCERVAVRVD